MFTLSKLVPAVLALVYAQAASAAPAITPLCECGHDIVRIPLNQGSNGLYTVDLGFGGPSDLQNLTVIFDSGSKATWVPGKRCTTTKCPGVDSFYNASASSTAHNLHRKEVFVFEEGSVIADMYKDDVSLVGAFGGDVQLKGYEFGSACTIRGFEADPTHGRLGFGDVKLIEYISSLLPDENGSAHTKRQHNGGFGTGPMRSPPTRRRGSSKPKRDNERPSELILGYDADLVSGDPVFFPLVCEDDIAAGESIYWKTMLNSVQFNHKIMWALHRGIVSFENGVNQIIAPCGDAEKIHGCLGEPQGEYVFKCSAIYAAGDLKFHLPGHKHITLPPSVWSREVGNDLCESLIRPSANEESKTWVLGTPVTDQFVEVYDFKGARYGLAYPSYFTPEASLD